MAFKSFKVPLPDKNISFKKGSGNARYVYLSIRHYRNKKGTPTHDEVSIGKLNADDPNTMFPNENYFTYYPWTDEAFKEILPSKIKMVGITALLYHRSRKIGLEECLKKTFPNYYKQILQCAFYILARGGVMMYMDDFYQKHENTYQRSISHKYLGELYEELTKEKRWEFFTNWKDCASEPGECVAYDVTSFSTEAKEVSLVEYGYNRDGEELPQVNVGTVYSQISRLPLCYELYYGSIADKSHLQSMMCITRQIGLSLTLYVMDRGFLTKGNLKDLAKQGINFLLGASSHQDVYRKFLLEKSPLIRDPGNHLLGLGVYGVKGEVTVEDETYGAFAYYSSAKAAQDETALYEQIKKRGEELEYQKGKPTRKKQDPYYNVQMQQGKIISYEKNEEKIKEKLSLCGMFSLLSNDKELTEEKALIHYRRRDGIEKLYDGMKNPLELYRLRTHTDTSTEGKFFLGFIAQILWADIIRVMHDQVKKNAPTVKAVLNEMEKIQKVSYTMGDQLLSPLSKKQKDILSTFEIDPEKFRIWILKKHGSL